MKKPLFSVEDARVKTTYYPNFAIILNKLTNEKLYVITPNWRAE